MPYPLQHKLKGEAMTPEEGVVFDALRHLEWEPEFTGPQDFAPTQSLYDTYRGHIAERGIETVPLNQTQFGVALRRVFGLSDDRKARRRVKGKLVCGYCYVRGTGTATTQLGPGNPNVTRPNHATDARATGGREPAPVAAADAP